MFLSRAHRLPRAALCVASAHLHPVRGLRHFADEWIESLSADTQHKPVSSSSRLYTAER